MPLNCNVVAFESTYFTYSELPYSALWKTCCTICGVGFPCSCFRHKKKRKLELSFLKIYACHYGKAHQSTYSVCMTHLAWQATWASTPKMLCSKCMWRQVLSASVGRLGLKMLSCVVWKHTVNVNPFYWKHLLMQSRSTHLAKFVALLQNI